MADSVFGFLLSFIGFSSAQAQTASLWSPTTTPAKIVDPDANSVGLSIKLPHNVNGEASAIRFGKSPTTSASLR